ncbi:NUDIX hydrolase [Paenibacillus sp. J2TS4]|uniref:NUDIX hydrolase n=1 Tax=Paenibacillus sp. J2TS4 TaxID=2807194 RepID=UPI001B125F4D|nr:NUDIX hydrolase [Paenibacillus sp. J2TS4]GIP32131.1 ADP-ribose pyrophosphatase [Paenibacillus sp. J2TS4]
MEHKWREWTQRLQSISEAGFAHAKDTFDRERFEQLALVRADIMKNCRDAGTERISTLFAGESGGATPKVAVRGVVFKEGKLLLVKEIADGKWSLPGGWADIGLSPKEIAVKEIREESGFEVQPIRLLALLDKRLHDHPSAKFDEYILFILCEIIGGEAKGGTETEQVEFFAEDQLPELSKSRNTVQQIRSLFQLLREPDKEVMFD